jgi:Ca2+-binding RTX toxin-like protein
LTAGTNFVDAGSGNDEIYVHHAEQKWGAGYVALNVHLDNEVGLQQAVSVAGFEKMNNVIDGGSGWDKLILSTANDALFLDDLHSSFHPRANVNTLTDGSTGIGRISSIEQIYAGQGNDVIDLVSSRFSLAGTNIEIFGEDGNDTLWGSDADEKIFGGNGNDFLFGGSGSDTLSGGNGADTFDFDIKFSGDTILDFDGSDGDLLRIFGANDADSHTKSWNGETLEFDFNFEGDNIPFYININLGGDQFSEIDWAQYILFM